MGLSHLHQQGNYRVYCRILYSALLPKQTVTAELFCTVFHLHQRSISSFSRIPLRIRREFFSRKSIVVCIMRRKVLLWGGDWCGHGKVYLDFFSPHIAREQKSPSVSSVCCISFLFIFRETLCCIVLWVVSAVVGWETVLVMEKFIIYFFGNILLESRRSAALMSSAHIKA